MIPTPGDESERDVNKNSLSSKAGCFCAEKVRFSIYDTLGISNALNSSSLGQHAECWGSIGGPEALL